MFLLLFFILLSNGISAKDNLHMAYRWKKLKIAFPHETDARWQMDMKQYIPENHLPFRMDVYKNRMFVIIPRLKPGVVTSVAYIKLSEARTDHPRFTPYPSRQFHNVQDYRSNLSTTIISAISLKVDRCDRLWILDVGTFTDGTANYQNITNPRIFIFNLKNDTLLNTYIVPEDKSSGDSYFVNMVVEDQDCEDTFAYLADGGQPTMVVYSYKSNSSWLIKYPYLHNQKNNYNAVESGLFGMTLSRPYPEGYSTMYFHPLETDEEFSVSTKVLRDKSLVNDKDTTLKQFKKLGNRCGDSGAMFLDQNTDVLFFTSLYLNNVNCWKTTKICSEEKLGTVLSGVSLKFISDIKVDANGTLWVLAGNLSPFDSAPLDAGLHNYEVFRGNARDIVKGTPCEEEVIIRHKKFEGTSTQSQKMLEDTLFSTITMKPQMLEDSQNLNSSTQDLCDITRILIILICVIVMCLW